VYVIDSGIYTKGPFLTPDGRPHYEFGGRAVNVYDALGNNGGEDCYGHGTHVAGTIGSANYGVAKQALLRGVRVFDCKGNTAGASVDAGIEWVTRYHLKPAVANMSLGLPTSDIRAHSWDSMVTNMVAAGVTVVVAAGNYNQDACYYSPARAPGTITVGATDWNDSRASFASSTEPASNYGSCVDIFAPGKGIWSTGIQWNSGTGSMQGTYISMEGTSMATPHVAGAAALYLQHYPWASPSSVRNALVNTATSGKIWYAGPGSPNRLLYSFTY
jgi:aqualysin 1